MAFLDFPYHSCRRDFDSPFFLPLRPDLETCCRPQDRYLFSRSRQPSHPETHPQLSQWLINRSSRGDEGDLLHLTPNQLLENLVENFIGSRENKKTEAENPVIQTQNSLSDLCLHRKDDGPFEIQVNLHGIDPEKVKVEVKEGVVQIEGRKESPEGSFTFVSHQQTLPTNVDPSNLKASLLSEGILKVCGERKQTTSLPIKISDERKSLKPSEKETECATEAETQQTQHEIN